MHTGGITEVTISEAGPPPPEGFKVVPSAPPTYYDFVEGQRNILKNASKKTLNYLVNLMITVKSENIIYMEMDACNYNFPDGFYLFSDNDIVMVIQR